LDAALLLESVARSWGNEGISECSNLRFWKLARHRKRPIKQSALRARQSSGPFENVLLLGDLFEMNYSPDRNLIGVIPAKNQIVLEGCPGTLVRHKK